MAAKAPRAATINHRHFTVAINSQIMKRLVRQARRALGRLRVSSGAVGTRRRSGVLASISIIQRGASPQMAVAESLPATLPILRLRVWASHSRHSQHIAVHSRQAPPHEPSAPHHAKRTNVFKTTRKSIMVLNNPCVLGLKGREVLPLRAVDGVVRMDFDEHATGVDQKYVVSIPKVRTERFRSSFINRTAKEWNSLPATMFPEHYNLAAFKSRVNEHLLGNPASS
ncbi:hypothetical protein MSG28_002802 [Choristoneura fumiferana]|uniref:Uncharacterized protein n=1 Tax=Choristoneura fumiferana TaxID=7141 RepID=A0ACC0JJQ2_CHOFU|nr:hypothetical protein MSG28_002802 [Choristoneura fumiferana]